MKVCSKCGRTYPLHVDFCLRDGHPLVAEAAEVAAPEVGEAVHEETVAEVEAEQPAIDIRSTTDAFFPSLSAQGDDAPPKVAEKAKDEPIDLRATEVISVARIREITQQIQSEFDADEAKGDEPPAKLDDPQSLVATTLIPRNWRSMIDAEEDGSTDEPTPTPTGESFNLAAPPEDHDEKTTSHEFGDEGDGILPTDPDGQAAHAAEEVEEAGVVPPRADAKEAAGGDPSQVPTLTGEAEPLATEEGGDADAALAAEVDSEGTLRLAAGEDTPVEAPPAVAPHPFANEAGEGIPSGFEDATPPDDGEEEHTGALSQPFIYNSEDDIALTEAEAPWEAPGPQPVIIPRGKRVAGEVALEDEARINGAAPPKGSFRRRAAFSHWPAPPVPEEADLGGAAPLADEQIEEWSAPAPAAPVAAAEPEQAWGDDDAAAVQAASSGRGWLGVAAVALIIAIIGAWFMLRGDAPPAAVEKPVVTVEQAAADPHDVSVAAPPPPAATAVPTAAQAELAVEETQPPAQEPTAASRAVAANTKPAAKQAPAPQPVAKAPAPKPVASSTRNSASRSTSRSARLEVAVDPAGAAVLVDGRARGVAPLKLDLPAGTYTVRAQKDGYVSKDKKVVLGAGRTNSLSLKLSATPRDVEPPKMLIIVGSQPSGAEIFQNGESIGKTPKTVRLGPGTYQFRLVSGNSPPFEKKVTIPQRFADGARQQVFAAF